MTGMTVTELLDEYNLSMDDVRWSLANRMAESIAHSIKIEGTDAVALQIWSGTIGDALYDMEERWLRERDDRLARSILDEGHLRDELSGMVLDKAKRY